MRPVSWLLIAQTQAAGHRGAAGGTALAYLVVLLFVLKQFFRNRRKRKLLDVSSIFAPPDSTT